VKTIQSKYNCQTIFVQKKILFLFLISFLYNISYLYLASILKITSTFHSYFSEQKYVISIPISILINNYNTGWASILLKCAVVACRAVVACWFGQWNCSWKTQVWFPLQPYKLLVMWEKAFSQKCSHAPEKSSFTSGMSEPSNVGCMLLRGVFLYVLVFRVLNSGHLGVNTH